jgi:hypothetical protein
MCNSRGRFHAILRLRAEQQTYRSEIRSVALADLSVKTETANLQIIGRQSKIKNTTAFTAL